MCGFPGGQQGSSQAALDIDWKTNAVFAVCSGNAVYVVKVGDREPMRKWSAHTGDVNALRVSSQPHTATHTHGTCARMLHAASFSCVGCRGVI